MKILPLIDMTKIETLDDTTNHCDIVATFASAS